MAQNPFSLEGKNAWITGASYGIGFNIAKAFVAAGIKTIIFNDINELSPSTDSASAFPPPANPFHASHP